MQVDLVEYLGVVELEGDEEGLGVVALGEQGGQLVGGHILVELVGVEVGLRGRHDVDSFRAGHREEVPSHGVLQVPRFQTGGGLLDLLHALLGPGQLDVPRDVSVVVTVGVVELLLEVLDVLAVFHVFGVKLAFGQHGVVAGEDDLVEQHSLGHMVQGDVWEVAGCQQVGAVGGVDHGGVVLVGHGVTRDGLALLSGRVDVPGALDDSMHLGTLGVPEINVALESGGRDVLSIGAECHTHDMGIVVEDVGVPVSGEEVMDADRLVPTAGGEGAVEAGEGQTVDGAFVASDDFHQLSCLELEGVDVVGVFATCADDVALLFHRQRDQLVAIWLLHVAEHLLPGAVVGLDRPVQRTTHHRPAVLGQEGEAGDLAGVFLERGETEPTAGVPKFHRPRGGACRTHQAIGREGDDLGLMGQTLLVQHELLTAPLPYHQLAVLHHSHGDPVAGGVESHLVYLEGTYLELLDHLGGVSGYSDQLELSRGGAQDEQPVGEVEVTGFDLYVFLVDLQTVGVF